MTIEELQKELSRTKDLLAMREQAIQWRDDRVAKAEEILNDKMDLTWCQHCENYTESEYRVLHRQTMTDPEEGVTVCEECGRSKE